MSTRLLLDEMFSSRIAAELAARGHDCIALVADPASRASSDEQVLRQAYDQGPAVVTNNVVDYERLRRQGRQSDDLLLALIYTSDRTFPRDRRYIGRLVNALDRACATDAVQAAGGVLWLQPVPPG